jgi:arylsulfatase A-like enzyme
VSSIALTHPEPLETETFMPRITYLAMVFAVGLSIIGRNSANCEEARPNVVMILSDDQAWGDYSFLGHPHIQTPRLDALAASGLTFTRGYVPDSLCRPSLATIISGMYPHQHGIVGNDPPLPKDVQKRTRGVPGAHYRDPAYVAVRNDYLRHAKAMTTLPEYLAPSGYRSMQSGKWWEGNFSVGGFDEGMTIGNFSKDGRHGDAGLKIGREGLAPVEAFLDKCGSTKQPFFLWYAPMLPHTPHDPPAALLEKYKDKTDSLSVAKYWAMCERFDQSCGELLDAIEKRGMTNNTIVVYVTDNGWITDPNESKYAPRSKRSPNEGGIRTPIMVSWPGHIAPRRDDTHLASSIDLVPTILDLVGVDIPSMLPGISLVNEAAVDNRHSIFGEIFEHDIVAMDDPEASLMYRWVIDGTYKLIAPTRRMSREIPQLYNLANDAAEDHDLAAEKPEVVKALLKKLDEA